MWGFIFLLLIGTAIAIAGPIAIRDERFSQFGLPVRAFGSLVVAYAFLSTSYVWPSGNQVAQFDKVFSTAKLENGRVIATKGEAGKQALVLGPGFHFSFLVNILNKVTIEEFVDVPSGKVGLLHARDGAPLRPEQTFADPLHTFSVAGTTTTVEVKKMISDAAYFLENGGQKGPQTTILTPGLYALNKFLWSVELADTTSVPKGSVAVVKSNVYGAVDLGSVLKVDKSALQSTDACKPIHVGDPKKLIAPLVSAGCLGIWNYSLPPGQYNINPKAYEVTLIDTTQQAWLYAGGFSRREIALEVDQEGKIVQKQTNVDIPVPKGAADAAIAVKVEGWVLRQAARALVQATPENAPFIVASVGGIREIEDRVVTPAIQSLLTDIAGGHIRVPDPQDPTKTVLQPTHALDFIEKRKYIEQMVESVIINEAGKAGVLIQEIRLLETDIPPELLVARKRQQLAGQLTDAYLEEKKAQTARITVEQEKATADQQTELVKATIAEQKAARLARAKKLEGEGERDAMIAISTGQREQATVLGQDKVLQLQMFTQFMIVLRENPKLLETAITNAHKFVPQTVVGSSSGIDLTAAAAMLMGMQQSQQPAASPPKTSETVQAKR